MLIVTYFVFIFIIMYIRTYAGVSNFKSSRTANITTVEWNSAISHSGCGDVCYIVTVVNLMDAGDVRMINQTQNKINITNSNNGAMYNISVAAVNRAGTGPLSTIIVTGNAIGDIHCLYIYV